MRFIAGWAHRFRTLSALLLRPSGDASASMPSSALLWTFSVTRSSASPVMKAVPAGDAEAKRAFDAMMTMRKIDIGAIEAARRG